MGITDSLTRAASVPVRLGVRAGGTVLDLTAGALRGARATLGHDRPGPQGAPPSRGANGPPPSSRPHGDALSADRGSAAPAGAGTAFEPYPSPDDTAPPQGDAVAPGGVPSAPVEPVEPPPPAPPPPEGDAMPAAPRPANAKDVDDDPVAVGEFGGPGAEEAAGAEVHVDPPWDHYDDMTAAQISDRLSAADGGVAAAVSLYESSRRGRKSVIRAADARLRKVDAARPG